jgi:hypothetical protein
VGRVPYGASAYLSHRNILGECRECLIWALGGEGVAGVKANVRRNRPAETAGHSGSG